MPENQVRQEQLRPLQAKKYNSYKYISTRETESRVNDRTSRTKLAKLAENEL